MTESTDLRQKLLREYQFHTEHNFRPPSGTVRINDEIEQAISESGESTYVLSRRPAIQPPLIDDSLPLQDYFISSSHNTYLLSKQLSGRSSAASYLHVLENRARCVEIDVWPSENGLIVTHGHTLVEGVPFSEVCSAIGESVVSDSWPVFVSLECHVPASGQKELVQQMVEAWGEKLVPGRLRRVHGKVTPADLKGRIILIVEYYQPGVKEAEEESPDNGTMENSEGLTSWFKSLFIGPEGRISDELAEYGYYARSMKPKAGWLTENITDPSNILINISESACLELLPASLAALIAHGKTHLRRVYPKGTRINSGNLDPLVFWRNGSQIAALNWQVYDLGMQLQEALFVGSSGLVPKPKEMRAETDVEQDPLPKVKAKLRLVVDVVGVSSLPAPNEREGKRFRSYIQAQFLSFTGDLTWRSQSVETQHDLQNGADVLWKEQIEWYYEEDDLNFIRLTICEDEVGNDDCIVVFCAKFDRLVKDQWLLLRMLNPQGKDSGATVLAKFTTEILR